MADFSGIDSILFDLDGTLWDSAEGCCAAWNIAFERMKLEKRITADELHGYMGMHMLDIARAMFPGIDDQLAGEIIKLCCEYEDEYLAEHGGTLFPQLEETLSALSKKYKLFIVSNCHNGYIEIFMKAHKLSQYFTDFECSGRTGLSKGENNRMVIERNNLRSPVFVGDTAIDRQSAIDAGIPFILARYGFGKVDSYDAAIDSIEQLTELL
jgi:phosphoglycolate phosphatase